MADAQQDDKPKRAPQRRRGVNVGMPGFEGEVSEDTARDFLGYTGNSWKFVVIMFGLSMGFLAICLGLSWLI